VGGRTHHVRDATLAAVLDALGPPPAETPQHPQLTAVAPLPQNRAWGFAVQLYSLRSRDSWGHGDLRDLADFATWAARDLGASFVLVNPLHAAEPVPPITASPYTPMSRRFLSPLYLRVEDIPEFSERRVDAPKDLRSASATSALIDRDAVWTAKRKALEQIFTVPLIPARQRSLDAYRVREGQALTGWATWCAIAETHGHDYRAWPVRLRDPSSAEVAEFRDAHSQLVAFHEWLQWQVAEQAADAQRAALDAGMSIGIVHDLAVGTFPGGFDAWADQEVLVGGLTVGAPPDGFNELGQNWALPPWHPGVLAAQGYQPLADLFDAVCRDAGALRVDHIMGLSRLWVIPEGLTPDKGTYLRYDQSATAGVLADSAARAGALAIGEDLGTVERGLRNFLSQRNILGTSMLWFEQSRDGTPLPPRKWRRDSLATVSTHDLPPAAAFLTGDYVTQRAKLGLLTRSEDDERADAKRSLDSWLDALARGGLLPRGQTPDATDFTAALYAYIAESPALLVCVSLADAVGERQPQNIPGTTDEYPNWRVPLSDGTGQPVLVEDLPGNAAVRTVARQVDGVGERRNRRA
jgi:4-alpha-glucanotransferase